MSVLNLLPAARAHLFPTTIAIVFAINFAFDISVTNFLSYILVTILGGVVCACQILAYDKRTLISINRAVRELGFSDYEIESHEALLSEPALNYFNRFLRRATLRAPQCFFVRCKGKPMKSIVAFAFCRYYSICIHSLDPIENQPKPRNLILFHELGHLFVHQPRTGYLIIIFGSSVPLLWLAYDSENFPLWAYGILFAILMAELLSVSVLDKVWKENCADSFALACWFTEYFNDWSEEKLAALHKRGRFFDEMPPAVVSYETYVASKTSLRRRTFNRCYARMNNVTWLNIKFRELDKMGGDKDLYWKEVFFRKAIPSYTFNIRNAINGAKFALMVYFCLEILNFKMSVSTGAAFATCAALSLIWVLILTVYLLEKVEMPIDAAVNKETSVYALFGAAESNGEG